MEIGQSRTTNMILRMLGEETCKNIDDYVREVSSRNFVSFYSEDDVNKVFGDKFYEFLLSLSEEELMDLRTWSSYNFSNINSILRGNWTYEQNGILTDDKRNEYKFLADRISLLFNKFNGINVDFITYRGTTLDSFKNYGINELSQLKCLKGKYLYEQGFTSTSLGEETCYFNKNFKDGKNYNIKLKYLVPSEAEDGILLMNSGMTHYQNEVEYLIDKGSLTKVMDVEINEETNTAFITVIFVSKKIYDLNYNRNRKHN